jgi:phosphoserine phosphatase
LESIDEIEMKEEEMLSKLALLDWDGTIRKDFTIRSWIKFLVNHGKLSEKAIEDIEEVFQLLFKGNISHDETSRRSASMYAFYLKGYVKAEITEMASHFVQEDSQYLCSFSSALFSYLSQSGVQIMVISGAPVEILLEYQNRFPIRRIHALELQTIDGIFTGEIRTNSGTANEKHLIVDPLLGSQMYEVSFAAGNSSSDLPLLEAASAAIIVNNQNLKIKTKCLYLTCESTDEKMMLDFLQKKVGGDVP